jgi:hypothetical protein
MHLPQQLQPAWWRCAVRRRLQVARGAPSLASKPWRVTRLSVPPSLIAALSPIAPLAAALSTAPFPPASRSQTAYLGTTGEAAPSIARPQMHVTDCITQRRRRWRLVQHWQQHPTSGMQECFRLIACFLLVDAKGMRMWHVTCFTGLCTFGLQCWQGGRVGF